MGPLSGERTVNDVSDSAAIVCRAAASSRGIVKSCFSRLAFSKVEREGDVGGRRADMVAEDLREPGRIGATDPEGLLWGLPPARDRARQSCHRVPLAVAPCARCSLACRCRKSGPR